MNWLCAVFGHRYYVIERFSPATRKVGCHRCKQMWGMNDRVQGFVEWDGELEEFHGEKEYLMSDYKLTDEVTLRKAIKVIENIVSDDAAECLCIDAAFPGRITKRDFKVAVQKITDIYCILHGINKDHSCYEVHDDWRKMLEDKYAALEA